MIVWCYSMQFVFEQFWIRLVHSFCLHSILQNIFSWHHCCELLLCGIILWCLTLFIIVYNSTVASCSVVLLFCLHHHRYWFHGYCLSFSLSLVTVSSGSQMQ